VSEGIEKSYEVSFQIIMSAGDAQDNAMKAIDAANKNAFDEAENLVKEAKDCLKEAHKSQTDLLAKEADGDHMEVNALMVHAYDHYAMALMAIDMAKMAISLNKKIFDLSGE